MKRRLRRLWKKHREKRIAPRLKEVLGELVLDVPELAGVEACRSGDRGHASNFKLLKEGRPVAVMRLLNPYLPRASFNPDSAIMLEAPAARIARELNAYQLGSPLDLTPTVIWHRADVLVCRYEPLAPLFEQFQAAPERCWELLGKANGAIHRLHHQLGLTHMDISMNNILADEGCERLLLVDFEYSPSPSVNLATQRAYDYLRLTESVWKYLPPAIKGDFGPWLQQVQENLAHDAAAVELAKLAPILNRILNDDALGPAIRALFPAAKQTAA